MTSDGFQYYYYYYSRPTQIIGPLVLCDLRKPQDVIYESISFCQFFSRALRKATKDRRNFERTWQLHECDMRCGALCYTLCLKYLHFNRKQLRYRICLWRFKNGTQLLLYCLKPWETVISNFWRFQKYYLIQPH